MRYHIETFGCQMNNNDSERIAHYLERCNYQPASSLKEADLIVVNMCSVRQSAVDRVYGLIPKFKELKKKNPDLKTVLTGCVLKQDQKKLKSKFDYILSKKTLRQWDQFLEQDQWDYLPDPRNEKFQQQYDADYFEIPPKNQEKARVYVPISTGCDNFCSFCVVPHARGPEVCRDPNEIEQEVRQAVKRGAKEIWLLGQNVNSYQQRTDRKKITFADLLRRVSDIEGKFRIKFTSSNPEDFDQRSIEALAELDRVAPYLNLPLQSGNDEILDKMNRPYSVQQYQRVVQETRKAFQRKNSGPLSLSTDIIVGFPGETKRQFRDTVEVFKEMKFDMAYIAQYSPRPRTAASKLKDDVSQEEKKRREKVLTEILKRQALEFNRQFTGETTTVVTLNKEQRLIGKTKQNKTVKFPGSKDLIGKFASVKVKKASPWGLTGKLI
ncbi:hypothetical protein AKJ56_00020 [candidate division MSBL1 archaeon SCGC-AAA382N08]|uniref:Probable threonylcarbamoyladenosine tRNA methylthiotransferase n=1 Tax=candidate division MSBL1 archaeon SCGC-AAA382N08 TaxID=1698285 RepID=A0A133VQV8_9EURY|nr:hypothetical protein AKJ56_00020 [candidate division MSBL1 archaeon SCGC-AAA382N08]